MVGMLLILKELRTHACVCYIARMPNKTLYVGPRQEGVWQRAEVFAAAASMSVSSIVTRALREYLERNMVTESGIVITAPEGDTAPPVVSSEAYARRMAARMWRLTGDNPGETLPAMRSRFAGKERPLFAHARAADARA